MCAAGRSSWGFDARRRPVGKTGFVLDKWRGKAPFRLLLLFFVRAEIAEKEGWKPCFSGQEVDVLRGHCMFPAVRL